MDLQPRSEDARPAGDRPTPPDRPAGTAPTRLRAVTDRLVAHGQPPGPSRPRQGWQASTALVLAPGPGDVEVAIIERTRRPGDRWSGQLALPGGRRDTGDRDLAVTAAREAEEEVGLRLGPPLARIAEHRPRLRPGLVACYAFVLDDRPRLVPEPREVATAWWVPLEHLSDPRHARSVTHRGLRFPAIDIDGRPLWGLTLLLLQRFAALVDLDLATG